MRVRPKRAYEPGFRQQAVALLQRTDRGVSEVAGSLGIPVTTLTNWYKSDMAKKREPKVGAASTAIPAETLQQKVLRLEQENAALKKQNADLQQDKDILKKAAAFFARENE